MNFRFLCLLSIANLFLSIPASGGELEKAKTEYVKQDRELNRIYAELKADLPTALFKTLREEQKEWISYRDDMSDWQAFGKEPATSPSKWEMAAVLTKSRVGWLEAWKLIGMRKGWSGKYVDSHGGLLSIMEKDGRHLFWIGVVRGPTRHTGIISGVLKVDGRKASYEVKAQPESKPTKVAISPLDDGSERLRVDGDNTSYFHGTRAYFDGDYLWVGELSEEEKKEVARDAE